MPSILMDKLVVAAKEISILDLFLKKKQSKMR